MSEERCFCHLNGLAVKDATARRELQNRPTYEELTQVNNNLNNSIQNVTFRQTEAERQISGVQSAVEELNNVVNNLDVPDAAHVSFDGSESGFVSENVQDAIGEVLTKAGTIKYDEETDNVYVLFNGEWVKWMSAHMLWDGHIFENGNTFEDITGGYQLDSNSSYYTLTNGNELDFARTNGYVQSINATVYTLNKIDVTEFSKMRVIGTVYSTSTNTMGYTCTIGLSSIIGSANVCSFNAISPGDNNSVAIDEIIDISSCNGEYYFTMYNDGLYLGGVKISSIQFYN